MKNTVKILSFSVVVLFLSIFFYSCSKDSSGNSTVPSGSQNISLYMTDAPGAFDKVLIDIRSVQVLVDTCNSTGKPHRDPCNVWETLNITPGIYDLLTLRNGSDTLLAGATIPNGNVTFIKIQLGSDNSLVKDSVSYPLQLRDSSIILVDVSKSRWEEFEPRRFRLWLDFDVSRSVVNVSGNQFYLDPFIRIFTLATTGSISGNIWPLYNAFPVVSVYNNSDTAYALPSFNGNFQVRGLAPGTYNVFVNASNGYVDTTITGVTVTAGGKIQLGKIKLHK